MANLKDLLWGVVRKAMRLCGVSQPARVIANGYDRTLRRASVQSQIRLRMDDGQVLDRAPLSERPVLLPRGGGFGLWFDLADGDPVVTLVADESTADYYATGQPSVPVFGQQHQQSDAVILPGGVSDPEQQQVNGPGQCVVGTVDLTACIIFSKATTESPEQAGKVEVRASVRVDIGGAGGQPIARNGDGITLDEGTIAAINLIATAAGAPALVPATAKGTIDARPGAIGHST